MEKDMQLSIVDTQATYAQKRKTYTQPSMIVYGQVSEITKGNNTNSTDKDNSQTKDKGGGASDRALKRNIVRIGTHPAGFGLYLFDYKPEHQAWCGDGRQFGVMADEVEPIVPGAVSVGPQGFKMVDYGQLGIERA